MKPAIVLFKYLFLAGCIQPTHRCLPDTELTLLTGIYTAWVCWDTPAAARCTGIRWTYWVTRVTCRQQSVELHSIPPTDTQIPRIANYDLTTRLLIGPKNTLLLQPVPSDHIIKGEGLSYRPLLPNPVNAAEDAP